MKPRTEILLYQLTWALDKMMQPTWRNLDSSFESWAYGNGLLRQIQRLEAQAFIESRRDERVGRRVIRLTAKGLAAGNPGPDPEQRWQRPWDGKWRVILFDLPEEERESRRKLREKLHSFGFGCMQRSAWISPDPLDNLAEELRPLAVNAANLVLLDAMPCGGEVPADMVRAAWDFKRIDTAWKMLGLHLAVAPALLEPPAKATVVRWATKERTLLQHCFRLDPFLPVELLPPNYQGMKIWRRRRQTLGRLAGKLC
jgi:phenylacetic acid degradation operon negative regulatory protein